MRKIWQPYRVRLLLDHSTSIHTLRLILLCRLLHTYFPIYSCIAYAVDQKTVRIRFKEDKRKTYSIQWTELLTPHEIPFENLDVLTPGTEVLAPYTVEGEGVQYSTAVVVSDSAVGEKKSNQKVCNIVCVYVYIDCMIANTGQGVNLPQLHPRHLQVLWPHWHS